MNPGGGYLPPIDTSDDEGENVAGTITDVLIVNPGYGYDPDDIIESPVGTLKPDLDEEGRIIGATVINSQIGIRDLPELTIPSKTGFGAVVKPVIEYKKVEDFGDVPITDVVRVIDCIQPY